MEEPLFDEGGQPDDKFASPIEARKKAMDYLARREHGRTELIEKLIRFGFDADVADDAAAQLVEDNLQSDAAHGHVGPFL